MLTGGQLTLLTVVFCGRGKRRNQLVQSIDKEGRRFETLRQALSRARQLRDAGMKLGDRTTLCTSRIAHQRRGRSTALVLPPCGRRAISRMAVVVKNRAVRNAKSPII
jgi:hypothetical protein